MEHGIVRENCDFSTWLSRPKRRFGFIGSSEKSMELKNKILRISKSDLPVLILGESGCGKTYTAKLIHDFSVRNCHCFFDVNVSALNENVAESELFGSVEGAFTDSKNRGGYFEKANKGTLFLDEIGEAKLSLQKSLLKVVETGEYRKVGSSENSYSDVRLIFATNSDLKSKIKSGEFREDLFYRMASLVISIPSLRERKEDIPEFCKAYIQEKGVFKTISESAMKMLCDFDWPGNIRQLQNTLDRALFYADGQRVIEKNHIEIY